MEEADPWRRRGRQWISRNLIGGWTVLVGIVAKASPEEKRRRERAEMDGWMASEKRWGKMRRCRAR